METNPSSDPTPARGACRKIGNAVLSLFRGGERAYWDASPDGGDWPATSCDLTPAEILEALDGIDDYLEPARRSLAITAAEGLRAAQAAAE